MEITRPNLTITRTPIGNSIYEAKAKCSPPSPCAKTLRAQTYIQLHLHLHTHSPDHGEPMLSPVLSLHYLRGWCIRSFRLQRLGLHAEWKWAFLVPQRKRQRLPIFPKQILRLIPDSVTIFWFSRTKLNSILRKERVWVSISAQATPDIVKGKNDLQQSEAQPNTSRSGMRD